MPLRQYLNTEEEILATDVWPFEIKVFDGKDKSLADLAGIRIRNKKLLKDGRFRITLDDSPAGQPGTSITYMSFDDYRKTVHFVYE